MSVIVVERSIEKHTSMVILGSSFIEDLLWYLITHPEVWAMITYHITHFILVRLSLHIGSNLYSKCSSIRELDSSD